MTLVPYAKTKANKQNNIAYTDIQEDMDITIFSGAAEAVIWALPGGEEQISWKLSWKWVYFH